jgi:hypothetical protein
MGQDPDSPPAMPNQIDDRNAELDEQSAPPRSIMT